MVRPLRGRHLGVITLFLAAIPSQAQYALNYADSTILIGAGQACLDAYNANVTCSKTIGYLYADLWPSLQEKTLDDLCASECFESLLQHRANISSHCGADVTYYSTADGSSWPPTYQVDEAIYGYNLTCLRRSDGQYCNTWFEQAVNETANAECDECYLKTAFIQAQSPLEPDPAEMQSMYASMSSSCSYTGPAATQTVTGLLIASPTATLSCDSEYPVQPGDTFLSISLSQNVATHDLITANGLSYNLTGLPTSGTLCIRNQCSVYLVLPEDTCESISTANSISLAQLHSWNAVINGLCNNLGSKVNQTICVSNLLGDEYIVPSNTASSGSGYTTPAPLPSNIAPDTTTSCGAYYDVVAGDDCGNIELKYAISLKDLLFLNQGLWENCTNLWANASYCVAPVGDISTYPGYTTPTRKFSITPQSATPIPWSDPFASSNRPVTIIPTANDTRTDCWDYLWWNATLGPPLGCWEITPWYGILREEFVLWNPSLAKNGTETITVSDANADLTATTPSTTTTITAYDYPCTIEPNLSYCVVLASPTPEAKETAAPPAPRASGEIADCTAWFPGVLDCASHISLLRMDLATFYKYNPSVKTDCSGYVLGTYYCYSTGSSTGSDEDDSTVTPTATTSTVPSTTGIQTPTPTQDGMISTCTAFYEVQSGDGCWAIANDHSISLDDFYAWNPAVHSDCSGLSPTYYVCVGIDQPNFTSTSSSSTSTRSSASTNPTTPASTDGTCGAEAGMTCSGPLLWILAG
ncbi:hypothetical protein BJX68DRAFT_255207 [Aspergillus pseudodeflectus]|uniref:LysM domain-containing protein n=1 Tax=Aspergillus pseudodeflectus TaxID=176178 RepID=A0ABR4KE21_9EURO